MSDTALATSSVQYRPAIDGMRAIAVLAVFVFHLKREWLPGGFVGVDIFFVISGYLITSILLRDIERDSFSLGKFYQRRIARLFPAFFTAALFTLIGACYIYTSQDLASCGANLTSATLSVANLKYMWQGNYFDISPDAQPFLHYWSLSVEEQFYIFFPTLLYLVCFRANAYKTIILSCLCGASLIACIVITRAKPEWAFFLLPTRAWELLAGSLLANASPKVSVNWREKTDLWTLLSFAGLAIIVTSLIVIDEVAFPGYFAVLPVLGAVCFIGPANSSIGLSERLLSWSPLVLIGRMSYSLYLWHWPVFSFVDYRYYLASPLFRIALKLTLSLAATAACFFLVENPSRAYFSHPARRRHAFAFLGCAVLFFVPLGIGIRRVNYVNADMSDVLERGLPFNTSGLNGSIVLMGDSNASMYGTMLRDVAYDLDLKLNVLSVAAGDPLPQTSGRQSQLWLNSLAVVKQIRPDFLVLVCNWQGKLQGDNLRLEIAVRELGQYSRRLILITQPPALPKHANRESMRNGSRPPFLEEPSERVLRLKSNSLVKQAVSDNIIVIDIERLFVSNEGIVRFNDDVGNQLYNDTKHLSGVGANVVKASVLNAVRGLMPL